MKFNRLRKSILRSTADIWRLLSINPRGIDLERRGHEVAKIFYAHFAAQVIREGYDPDDVLQDIYQGIIMRNRGVNPYNPKVSKFGHYVYLVCTSVWINYRQKYGRHRSFLVSDQRQGGDSDELTTMEWADTHSSDVAEIEMMLQSFEAGEREILVDLAQGVSKSEVQRKGYTRSAIESAIEKARIAFMG